MEISSGGPPKAKSLGFPQKRFCELAPVQHIIRSLRMVGFFGPHLQETYEVHGAITEKWDKFGRDHGMLGFPISDEHGVAGGRQSDFEHGSLYWIADQVLKEHLRINNSPRYNTTVFKVDVGENMFSWFNKQGSIQYGYSIENILDKYGYTGDHDPKKPRSRKPNSIIMVNLISPKQEYKDYGKTSINLEPFRDAIGETLYKVCSGGGGGRSANDRPSKVSVVLEILTERRQKWYSLDTASERQKYRIPSS